MHPKKAYPLSLKYYQLQTPGQDPSLEFRISPEKALLQAILERAIRDGLRAQVDGVKPCERKRARRRFLTRGMEPGSFDWLCHYLRISERFKQMLIGRARALASEKFSQSLVVPVLENYRPGQVRRCH